MDSFVSFLNGSLLDLSWISSDALWSVANQTFLAAEGITNELCVGNFSGASTLLHWECGRVLDHLAFDEFQLKLLREFSLILAGNSVLVFLAWKVYGPRISAKFMRSGASRRVIEELRTSMSELQLPKEHDFKFK